MKISIIIPIYNQEKFLNRCVDSVLNQTYKNLEIILVNDGSTDNSAKIIENYSQIYNRIRIINKKNGGISSARNAGLSIANGDFLAFVDSDDWIENDIYEHCLSIALSTDSDVVDFGIIFSSNNNSKFDSKKRTRIETVLGDKIIHDYLLTGQKGRTPFSVCRKLYKRNLFNNIWFPEGKINEDIVTNYKVLLRAKKLSKTDKIGYHYFQDGTSTTRGGLKERDFDLIEASTELYELTIKGNSLENQKLAKIKLGRSYFSLLAKIAFYGIKDDKLDYRKTIDELTKELRKYYFLLMKSPIPINRKIMIALLCINFNLLKAPLNIYKNLK